MAAGEASGDMLAALVLPALHGRIACECAGIGGDHMLAAGFNLTSTGIRLRGCDGPKKCVVESADGPAVLSEAAMSE